MNTNNNFIKEASKELLNYFKNKNIAVLYGGMSEERGVSLRSGQSVYNALSSFDELKNHLHLIDVVDGYSLVKELKEKKIDYCYNILHGTYGEDGKIQGLLDMLGIKYTGENVSVSALCMDKIRTKILWNNDNILNAAFDIVNKITKHDNNTVYFSSGKKIKYPFIIKPIENGSSVGLYMIKNKTDFENTIKEIENKSDYFVEQYIKGKEYTLGIIPKPDGTKHIFPILAILPKNEMYDYEAKYTKGLTDFEIPAKLDKNIQNSILSICTKAYELLGARGLCRIDFIIDNKNDIYLLECNTQPGMTETSDVPEMATASDIEMKYLVLYILGLSTINQSFQEYSHLSSIKHL